MHNRWVRMPLFIIGVACAVVFFSVSTEDLR
jgi:hypothetical protein